MFQQIVDGLSERDLLEDAKRVAKDHHVTLEEILGRPRGRVAVRARHAFWKRLSEEYGFSPSEIGRMCGADHSTVDSALKKTARAA